MNWQFNGKLQLSRGPCRELAHNMVAQVETTSEESFFSIRPQPLVWILLKWRTVPEMPLLTNYRKNTTLSCVKKPQTTSDSMRGSRKLLVLFKYGVLTKQSHDFRNSPLLCGPSDDLGHYVPWAKSALSPPEAVLPSCRISNPSFQQNFSSKHHKNQMLVSRVQTWRPGNSEVPRPLRTARSRPRLSSHAPRPNFAAHNEYKVCWFTPGEEVQNRKPK